MSANEERDRLVDGLLQEELAGDKPPDVSEQVGARLAAASAAPQKHAGVSELGGFEILSKAGQGGMGVVYRARQKSLDRIVALKILPPKLAKDEMFVKRFQSEARAAAKFNHPNIVQVFDVGVDKNFNYLAMEYVDGKTVKQDLEARKRLPEKEALLVVRQVASALVYAEEVGIVHRDIKPDNIMISSKGVAKLADLGLAKQVSQSDESALTLQGSTIGTPYYMSPEQVKGVRDIDIRSDLYSLGATLFHMVTGRTPFEGDTPAMVLVKHINEKAPDPRQLNAKLSEGCAKLVNKLLRKDRERRIQTAKELIEQVDIALKGGAVRTGSPALERTRAAAPGRAAEVGKSRVPLYAGIGAAAAALIVLALLMMKEEPPRREDPLGLGAKVAEARDEKEAEPVEEEKTPGGDEKLSESGPETMLAYVDDWRKEHGEDYAELIERFEKVAKAAEGTSLEFAIADKVRERVEAVRKRQDEAAEAVWKGLEERVTAGVERGDYDAAIAALTEVPEKFEDLLKERAGARDAALRKEAEDRIGKALAAAQARLDAKEPEKGLAALNPAEGVTYRARSTAVAELKGKLTELNSRIGEMRQKEAEEAVEERFSGVLKEFDAALVEAGDVEAARALVRKAKTAPELKPYTDRVKALDDVITAIDHVRAMERKAMDALKGTQVNLETKDGRKVKGKVERSSDDTIYVAVSFGGGSATMPVKKADLSEEQKAKFRGEYTPGTPAQKVAAAVEMMRKNDLAGASQMLAGAEDFPLTAGYQKLLLEKKLGASEVAARDAWSQIQDFKGKNQKLNKESGTQLLAMLTDYEKTHLETEFGRTKQPEIPPLKEWAEDAVVGFSINKLFKGKVERFDPETRVITLFWDFESEEQIDDWADGISGYTGVEVHAKDPSGPPVAKIAGGQMRKPKSPGPISAQTKAQYEGDIEITFETGDSFGHCGGGGIIYRNPADAPRFHYMRWRTQRTKDGKGEAYAAHGISYNVASQTKPFSHEGDKPLKHTFIVKGEKVSYLIDDKPYISEWWPVHEKVKLQAERPLMYPFLLTGAYGPATMGFDNVRITGTLRKKWLDEKIAEFKASQGVAPTPTGSGAAVQKHFRGKVENFDPATGAITLLYDFKEPEQAGDWPETTKVSFKNAANGHKALFTGTMEFSLQTGPKGASLVSRKPGGEWSLLVFSITGGRNEENKGKQVAQTYQFNPGYNIQEAVYEGKPGARDTHGIKIEDGRPPVYWVNGKKLVTGKVPVQCGEVRPSVPDFTVTNVRIKGTLEKSWLEKVMEQP